METYESVQPESGSSENDASRQHKFIFDIWNRLDEPRFRVKAVIFASNPCQDAWAETPETSRLGIVEKARGERNHSLLEGAVEKA